MKFTFGSLLLVTLAVAAWAYVAPPNRMTTTAVEEESAPVDEASTIADVAAVAASSSAAPVPQARVGGLEEGCVTTEGDPDADCIQGVGGRDYPAYDALPMTRFSCAAQQWPGLYADVDTQCQAFHVCQADGRADTLLCPRGTVFDQRYMVCQWWYDVDCADSPMYYPLNAQLYTSDSPPDDSAAAHALVLPPLGHRSPPAAAKADKDYGEKDEDKDKKTGEEEDKDGTMTTVAEMLKMDTTPTYNAHAYP